MTSVKLLEKRMARALSTEDFYAYEQAASTLFHRLSVPSAPISSHLQAVSRAFAASASLTQAGQPTAGAALALLALRHLAERGVAVEDPLLGTVRSLSASFPPGLASRREQLRVAKAALKWTSSPACRGTQFGDAEVNAVAGRTAAELGEYAEAVRFFIRGNVPEETAAVLVDWCGKEGLASERDLFLTRAVLQYVAAENVGDAGVLIKKFCEIVGWTERSADSPPLLGFCEMVVMAARLGRPGRSLWEKIIATYGKALEVDPALKTLVTRIGEMYFGIAPPAPSGMAGMMQGMLRGMMAN